VTAAQLARLAELGAYASGFFCTTNPEAARVFRDAAIRAEALATEFGREEQQVRQRIAMGGVSPEPSSARSHPR
jgi:hypothetical protein